MKKLQHVGTALTLEEKQRCEALAQQRGWDTSDAIRFYIRLGMQTEDLQNEVIATAAKKQGKK